MIPQFIQDEVQKSVYVSAQKSALASGRTEAEANYLATLAAMHYGDKAMQGYKVPQDVANYLPYGASAGAGCATCWWFNSPDMCRVVEGAITPTGKSDFYLDVQAVTAALPTAEIKAEKGIFQKIVQSFKKETKNYGFKTLEAYGREDLWVAWYTNPYQDRDGEFFTEAAIAADVKRMQRTKRYPELWWRHIPGSKHGQALGVWKIERFAVAIGKFDDTPLGQAFQQFYKSTKKKIGVSHGYYYYASQKQGNTYTGHSTFEITALFENIAANAYAGFALNLGEKSKMALTPEERAELLGILSDPQLVDEIAQMTAKRSQELDNLGIARKAKKGNPPPPPEEDDEEDEEEDEKPAKKPAKKSSAIDPWQQEMLDTQKQLLEAIKSLVAPTPAPATPAQPQSLTGAAGANTVSTGGDIEINRRLKALIDGAKSAAEPEEPAEMDPTQFVAHKMFAGLFGGQQ